MLRRLRLRAQFLSVTRIRNQRKNADAQTSPQTLPSLIQAQRWEENVKEQIVVGDSQPTNVTNKDVFIITPRACQGQRVIMVTW